MANTSSQTGGVTLFELMGLVVLVAAICAVVTPKLFAIPSVHRDQQRVADLKQVRSYLEGFYQEHQAYPVSDYSGLGGALTSPLPKDPSGSPYLYRPTRCSPTCQGFELETTLEQADDPHVTVGPDRFVLHE